MEALGGVFAIFGVIIVPLIVIVGLIKPQIFSNVLQREVGRKAIGIWGVVISVACIAIGGALLPPVEETDTQKPQATTANKTATEDTKVEVANNESVEIDNPVVNQDKKDEVKEVVVTEDTSITDEPLADFGVTPQQFVNKYNGMIKEVDKNWIINYTDNGNKTVNFAPMPNSASLIGTLADNGKLRGIILGLSGGGNSQDNLQLIAISLATANAVKPPASKEEVAKVVTKLITDAVNNEGKSQGHTIGNVRYAVLFAPSLGGLIVTIDAK